MLPRLEDLQRKLFKTRGLTRKMLSVAPCQRSKYKVAFAKHVATDQTCSTGVRCVSGPRTKSQSGLLTYQEPQKCVTKLQVLLQWARAGIMVALWWHCMMGLINPSTLGTRRALLPLLPRAVAQTEAQAALASSCGRMHLPAFDPCDLPAAALPACQTTVVFLATALLQHQPGW